MSLLVTGTICFDTIETPHGVVDRVLGGSGVFAAFAAGFFTRPRLVGVVGDDFTAEARQTLTGRGVCLKGVQVKAGRRTQFWRGRYHPGLHTREHVAVDLDILDDYDPVVPDEYRDSTHVLLAHMPPHLQTRLLGQVRTPQLVLADTIDYWITTRRAELTRLLPRVDGLIVNDQEAQLLSGEQNVLRAARVIRGMGPTFVIVKKGEHGVVLHVGDEFIALPAYPTSAVVDPTGAGDTFAGGIVGRLDADPAGPGANLRRAMAYGTVLASFTVEGFGLDQLARTTPADVDDRLARYREMLAV
ncbi:MAG: PfkB domain protein [Gemmataceae bacterium]|nr:PfkB domain protein [Gemmataceae bacterium]